MIIGSGDNWFNRCNRTMYQIRGRQLGREEFTKYAVGAEFLHWVEAVSDDAEADRATTAQEVGQTAIRDNWEGQILTLQASIKELNTEVARLAGDDVADKEALQGALAKIVDLTAELEAKTSPDASKPVVTTPPEKSDLSWLTRVIASLPIFKKKV